MVGSLASKGKMECYGTILFFWHHGIVLFQHHILFLHHPVLEPAMSCSGTILFWNHVMLLQAPSFSGSMSCSGTILFWHHPDYSSETFSSTATVLAKQRQWMEETTTTFSKTWNPESFFDSLWLDLQQDSIRDSLPNYYLTSSKISHN